MIIAAVFLVIGILGIVIAGVAGSSLEETLKGLETAPYTSDITPGEALTHTDDDNAGEMGWYLLILATQRPMSTTTIFPTHAMSWVVSITDGDGDDIGRRVATIDCEEGWNYYDISDHTWLSALSAAPSWTKRMEVHGMNAKLARRSSSLTATMFR